MKKLIEKYEKKLIDHGLCDPGLPLIGGLDAAIEWNRTAEEISVLKPCFDKLNINSILFAKPKEPYFSLLNFLAKRYFITGEFRPNDTETRTFLHTIPVTANFSSDSIIPILKKRKTVFVIDKGIISYGTVTPEQAFVSFSSVCFAGFVKFFTDYYQDHKKHIRNAEQVGIMHQAVEYYNNTLSCIPEKKTILSGPFNISKQILTAMTEAGKMLVNYKMVDSFFGNISYFSNGKIYISQTGSSLDELEGHIDQVPVDGTSSTGLTASSEYTAHRDVLIIEEHACILHGHPKFSVILSMLCDKKTCNNKDLCYKKCTEKRFAGDIPIIPGEVGTGPTGLSKTLPDALKSSTGAIVYGHGLFIRGKNDFGECLNNLVHIEKTCFKLFLEQAL